MSLVGYSPRGREELDMTEQLTHTERSPLPRPTPHPGGVLRLLAGLSDPLPCTFVPLFTQEPRCL